MNWFTCTVNGIERSAHVEPRRLLSDYLRHDLRLTGTHVGCEQGVCGACTVIVDGRAIRSCLVLAVQCDGSDVSTVESLCDEEGLSLLQTCFAEQYALQCGFCTPGFLMSVMQYFESAQGTSDQDVIESISGNLCRCTGYLGIAEAVRTYVRRRSNTQAPVSTTSQ